MPGWNKLSKILRKYIKDLNYIWVVEPHSSGYPHLHVVIFTKLPDELQEKITKLWSEKYQTGSKDHGVDFTTRTPEEDIDSLRNYLMKYIAKGFVSTGSKFVETTWTKEELVFNALIWKYGFLTFQPSRNLQKIMGWKTEKKDSIWWYMGESEFEDYVTKDRIKHKMWERLFIPEWMPFR